MNPAACAGGYCVSGPHRRCQVLTEQSAPCRCRVPKNKIAVFDLDIGTSGDGPQIAIKSVAEILSSSFLCFGSSLALRLIPQFAPVGGDWAELSIRQQLASQIGAQQGKSIGEIDPAALAAIAMMRAGQVSA
jgi:hypothetical protein